MNEQQVNRQHPIPQNFMDVEFKIVADFTVRQFIYLCATAVPAYLIYNAALQGFLKAVGVIFFVLSGLILVFVPIDDRSADVWIVNFFRAVYGKNRRVWRKTPKVPKTLTLETIKIVQGEMITLAPTASRRKLEEYLKGVSSKSEGDDLDFNFSKSKFVYIEDEQLPRTTTISPELPVTQVTFAPDTRLEPKEVKPVEEKPAIQEVTLKLSKPFVEKPIEPEIEVQLSNSPQPKSQPLVQKIAQVIPTKITPIVQKIVPIKPKEPEKPKEEVHEEFRVTSGEIPGRKFVSFSEKEQELILPLRGERKINLFDSNIEDESKAKDIKTLAKELRTIVREIKVENKDFLDKKQQTQTPEIKDNHEISGIIFDSLNNPISNIMVALTDSEGHEIKYARTDNLGKFILKDTDFGDFQIKVLNPEVFNMNFDIIKLSINNYPVPIIQIIGKQK